MYNALPLENSEFDDDQDILLSNSHQLQLFTLRPPKQLLKWVGNKQRYACQIVNLMPDYRTYVEPFLGSGAVLGTLAPLSGVAGDILEPLVKIWQLLQTNPQDLLAYYTNVWYQVSRKP